MKTSLELIEKISGLMKDLNATLQDPFFEAWALTKKQKLEDKLKNLPLGRSGVVYLGAHLHAAESLDSRRKFVNLPENFLLDPPKDLPDNSVFLLLNNDIARYLPQYLEFYNNNRSALFVVWDWDSQHWIQMSSIVAMNSDFYISATSENAFLLSQFTPYVLGPVFVGVHQWSRSFLAKQIDTLLEQRIDSPFGAHVFYGDYPRRNRAIATVSSTFPTVGFVGNDYKDRSATDNLREWARHKTHWIMPVLGGVPIRVYNALITGGIPILPSFYKTLPEVQILGDTPVYYELGDLLESRTINQLALHKFDSSGGSGLVERICQAMERHHIDRRCDDILNAVEIAVAKIRDGDRSHDLGYLGIR